VLKNAIDWCSRQAPTMVLSGSAAIAAHLRGAPNVA
jgi:NAD(P)H-dependent FMN reductase